jgi:hypothetical protein
LEQQRRLHSVIAGAKLFKANTERFELTLTRRFMKPRQAAASGATDPCDSSLWLADQINHAECQLKTALAMGKAFRIARSYVRLHYK